MDVSGFALVSDIGYTVLELVRLVHGIGCTVEEEVDVPHNERRVARNNPDSHSSKMLISEFLEHIVAEGSGIVRHDVSG